MGTLWGVANLFTIGILSRTVLISKQYNYALLLSLVKFPLLYGAGYLLLTSSLWNPWYVVVGAPLIFIAALIAPWISSEEVAW